MKPNPERTTKLKWMVLILICMTPRAIGLTLNSEANDDHIEVIEKWQEIGSYPTAAECSECFQPPLFYCIVYGVAEMASARDRGELINVAHCLHFLLSLVILGLLYRQIVSFELTENWKTLLFLFFGLNPKLIAINIQATNDTLLIAIGMMSYHYLLELCGTRSTKTVALVWMSLLAAGITKGNGLVLVVLGSGIALITILCDRNLHIAEKAIGICLFTLLLPVGVGLSGGYVARYEQFGEPFRINQEKAPPPGFAEYDGHVGKRMGIRSIVDGYLTFRLSNLLQHPHLGASEAEFEEHRTSFWTMLYAQAFHCQYEQYPNSWRSSSPAMINTARVLYLLGFVPVFLVVCGGLACSAECLRSLKRLNWWCAFHDFLPIAILACYLLFLVKYSFDYRDFATIKLVFIMPALAGFVALFARGINFCSDSAWQKCAQGIVAIICLAFANNLALLLLTLARL